MIGGLLERYDDDGFISDMIEASACEYPCTLERRLEAGIQQTGVAFCYCTTLRTQR
jgi:hypothetical protein